MWFSATAGYENHVFITWAQSKLKTPDLQFTFVACFLFFSFVPNIGLCNPTTCGGIYKASRGVVQTPDFPNRFQTPINYEWIIDASHIGHCSYNAYSTRTANYTSGSSNHSIVIYFTQVYVLRGLSFTEYYNYSSCGNNLEANAEFKDEGRKIKVDPFSATYVQSCANFLVIRLNLENVVGTHVRVLNNFLDVYGFNITYEISSVIRHNPCKISSCGFTGYCYDNFEKFFCDCLPGFEGPHCSDGPKSLCVRNGVTICKDNASYKLVGDTACSCENVTRKKGKSPSKSNSKDMILTKSIKHQLKSIRYNRKCADCRISCPFNEKHKSICECSKVLKMVHNPEEVHYSSNLSLKIVISYQNNSLLIEDYLRNQITQMLQICNATTNSLTIEKIDNFKNDLSVYFHFYGFRDGQHELQYCVRNFCNNVAGNFTFLEMKINLNIEPTLFLERLTINKKQAIREGQEFILSCMAIGSPNMAFRWYKDNMFINITTPIKSNKWMQLVRKDVNNNNRGAYWSVLVVRDAKELDGGWFTCQVIDGGRQQCESQRVFVTVAPTVFIEPMSLTVKQGEAFFIKCRDSSRWANKDNCNFNWLEDGIQLLGKADSLLPIGSLLKIPGINRTTTYTCSKTCTAKDIFKEAIITVYVYDPSKEIPCTSNYITNISQNLVHWPDTTPHAVSIVGCPENYTGFVSRMCLLSNQFDSDSSITKGKIIGKWAEPDYSGCLHDELDYIKRNFEKLELGYEYTTVLKIINEYKKYVITMDGHILSSEGRRILLLLNDVLTYVEHSGNLDNIQNITNAVLDITDVLLMNNKAIYTKNDIIDMQRVVKKILFIFKKTVETFEIFRNEFNITLNDNCNDQLIERNNKNLLLCIYYFNLVHKVSQVRNNSAIEYQLISDIKTVIVLKTDVDEANKVTVTFNITDSTKLDQVNNLHDEWRTQCLVSDWGFDWNENACKTIIAMERHVVKCRCDIDGTIAVAYVKKLIKNYGAIQANEVVIPLLYAVSMLMSFVCGLISIIQFHPNKSAVSFMLFQSSISKLINCGIFAFGSCSKFAQESYLYILTAILFSYLLALSSQLAIIMITYSELENVLHKEGAKIVAVEIFIVGFILVAIGNYIAHTSNVLKVPSWWILMADNLSFNVFIICLVVMMVLFITLYWIVRNFLKKEINLGSIFVYKKYTRIKKCSYVFCAFLANVIVSIFYINFVENILLHYVLVFTFILIDSMILIFITDCQRFHIKEITINMRNPNTDKSLRRMYMLNKNEY